MTAKQIIESNQILTLDKAQSLIGKTILVTNPEDRANEPRVREVEVSLFTAYDYYTNVLMPRICGNDKKAAEKYYNEVVMPRELELKNTVILYDSDGKITASCYKDSAWFDVPTFTGSDENRQIYFVEK